MDMIDTYDQELVFIPYDDDNLEQVLSGPKYGQPWEFETDSDEIELVFENSMLKRLFT